MVVAGNDRGATDPMIADLDMNCPVRPLRPSPDLPVPFQSHRGLKQAQRASGDAELVERLQLPPGLLAIVVSNDDAGIAFEEGVDLFAFFTQEIDAEAADTELFHPVDILGRGLSHAVVDGISATGVGMNGERRPYSIT